IEPIGSLRSDGEESRVEAALLLLGQHVLDLLAAGDRHAHCGDACDLVADDVARQAIGGNAPAHHAAGLLGRLANLHVVAEPCQVIRTGKTGGTGADDQDAMPGRLAAARLPFLLPRNIAHEALDCVNADGGVEVAAVTLALAGVIAGPAVNGREGIVVEDLTPRLLPSSGSRMLEPGLNVLSSRTGCVAGRQVGDPLRQLPPCRSGARLYRRNAGGIGLLQHQCDPPAAWARGTGRAATPVSRRNSARMNDRTLSGLTSLIIVQRIIVPRPDRQAARSGRSPPRQAWASSSLNSRPSPSSRGGNACVGARACGRSRVQVQLCRALTVRH